MARVPAIAPDGSIPRVALLYIVNTIRSFVLVPQILATCASGTGSALIWNPVGMIARNTSPTEFTNRWFETLPSPLPINSNPELRNDAAGRVIDPPDNDPICTNRIRGSASREPCPVAAAIRLSAEGPHR